MWNVLIGYFNFISFYIFFLYKVKFKLFSIEILKGIVIKGMIMLIFIIKKKELINMIYFD